MPKGISKTGEAIKAAIRERKEKKNPNVCKNCRFWKMGKKMTQGTCTAATFPVTSTGFGVPAVTVITTGSEFGCILFELETADMSEL